MARLSFITILREPGAELGPRPRKLPRCRKAFITRLLRDFFSVGFVLQDRIGGKKGRRASNGLMSTWNSSRSPSKIRRIRPDSFLGAWFVIRRQGRNPRLGFLCHRRTSPNLLDVRRRAGSYRSLDQLSFPRRGPINGGSETAGSAPPDRLILCWCWSLTAIAKSRHVQSNKNPALRRGKPDRQEDVYGCFPRPPPPPNCKRGPCW